MSFAKRAVQVLSALVLGVLTGILVLSGGKPTGTQTPKSSKTTQALPSEPVPEKKPALPVNAAAAAGVGAFTDTQAAAYEEEHLKEFPKYGMYCMDAIYTGLAVLYSRPEARMIKEKTEAFNMDLIMETLRRQGKAGPPKKLSYDAKKNGWGPDPEQAILDMTSPTVPGWYFFGLSLHRAYHSVMIVVDRTDLDHPQFYWIDQGAGGFTEETNVTGKLQEHMGYYKPPYGYQYSEIWQLLPPKPETATQTETAGVRKPAAKTVKSSTQSR